MKYGIEIVPFGEFGQPQKVVEMAQAAEVAGWEALWIWDHISFPFGVGDPWVILSAVAAMTQKIKLVTGVSPLPRYRPHVLARLLVSLDQLSNGRLVLGAGLGGVAEEFTMFGESGDTAERAARLDESLEVLEQLWTGETITHTGTYYTLAGASQVPLPLQKPRIPVWIGGDSRPALRRAARWDGWIIGTVNERCEIVKTPEQLSVQVRYIREHRQDDAPFDVAIDGVTQPGENDLQQSYAQAGATWWFESLFGLRGTWDEMMARIQAGPPL